MNNRGNVTHFKNIITIRSFRCITEEVEVIDNKYTQVDIYNSY